MIVGAVLLVAVCLDRGLGDPSYRWHPVRLLGTLIAGLEGCLYSAGRSALLRGGVLLGLVVLLVAGTYLTLRQALGWLPASRWPWAAYGLDIFLLYSAIAFQDLFDHVQPIIRHLRGGDIASARQAVQRIVGRDAQQLDEPGVARAAVESVAESLSDGLVGPVTYFILAGAIAVGASLTPSSALACGVAAAWIFRAVNTLDSMVGYRSERYLYFGRASARCDDLLGWIPARIAVFSLALASVSMKLSSRAGWIVWWRDRYLHPSPNAGQSESFVAGVLGLRLGGPTAYAHGITDKPWMGAAGRDATVGDLQQVMRLVRGAGSWFIFGAWCWLAGLHGAVSQGWLGA